MAPRLLLLAVQVAAAPRLLLLAVRVVAERAHQAAVAAEPRLLVAAEGPFREPAAVAARTFPAAAVEHPHLAAAAAPHRQEVVAEEAAASCWYRSLVAAQVLSETESGLRVRGRTRAV